MVTKTVITVKTLFYKYLSKKSGARGRRFDASCKHHPVTESSYINSLANRLYRSTVKTLPATLPEPWTLVRWPMSKHQGPWSTDLEPCFVDRVPRFKLRGSRLVDAGRGLLGPVARSGTIWLEGAGGMLGVLAARADGGDGWVEAEWYFFIYLPHLVLSAILDVTYSVASCTAPS